MFRKYFKMDEEKSVDVFTEYEAHTQNPRLLREALITAFNDKWGVELPMVFDNDGSGETIVIGYRVPFEQEDTPDWAIRVEFPEKGNLNAFWKPNSQTTKGKEFSDDLQLINNHRVMLFTEYIVMKYIGVESGIMDEQSQLHVPVAGRLDDMILMNVPVVNEGEFVEFIELGFVQVTEGEFTHLVSGL